MQEEDPDDDQEDNDVGIRFDGDTAETVEDGIVGTRATTINCTLTLLQMLLELNEPWENDDSGVEKRKRAKQGGKRGPAWAEAIRTHSNGTIGH